MDRMSWKDLEKAASGGYVLTLVVGSTEQHGPHLPLGVDVFIPMGIAERVAKNIKGIVAPPITYGYYSQPRSGGGQTFIGTTSVSSSCLLSLITDIMTEFLRHGFRKFLIINGHFENMPIISEGVEKALDPTNRSHVKVLILNYWDLITEDVIEKVFHKDFPGWDVEHASIAETSMMMLLRPDIVQMDKATDDMAQRRLRYDVIPPPKEILTKSGVLWKATLASREKGQLLLDTAVREIVAAVKRDLL